MILNFIKKLVTLKGTVSQFFAGLAFVLQLKDRLDDDLDNDGKSQLENIWEKLVKAEEVAVEAFKEVLGLLHDASKLGLELQVHVLTGKEKGEK